MPARKNYGAVVHDGEEKKAIANDSSDDESETAGESEALLGPPADFVTRSQKVRNSVIGVTFSLLSGACFTGSNFLIKEFSADVSDVVLLRYVLQIIILSTVIVCLRERVWPDKTSDKCLTVCQGLTGSMNVITGVAYVSFMPVADGLTLVFCSPAVTILLSCLVLGDRLTLAKTVSALALVSGALLVCQPPVIFGSDTQWSAGYLVGVGLATTSCVTGGLTNVLIAKAQRVHMTVLVFWVAVCGMAISILYSLLSPQARLLTPFILSISLTDWMVLISSALGGLAAFSLLTKALQMISPSLVASLRSLMLVLAFCVQTLLTGQLPNIWDWLGGGLVVGGVVLLAI